MREVQAAARRHAGIDALPRWGRRARAAAFLPDLSLRVARGLAWDAGAVERTTPVEVDHRLWLEARLTWRFDRALFEPAEPRLFVTERAAARARTALDQEVTTLYFRWRRAELERAEHAAQARFDGVAADPRAGLDAEEAFALLDARTGGWLGDRCPGGTP